MVIALIIGGKGFSGFSSSSSWVQLRNRKNNTKMISLLRVFCCCSSSSSVMDPYKTLRIRPNASESEVKKAFRQLALQYHPDVCRGSNCGTHFQTINEAYDIVLSQLESQSDESDAYDPLDQRVDVGFSEMNDPDWEMWEEWMGWEGAGIRDYTSHINPYI